MTRAEELRQVVAGLARNGKKKRTLFGGASPSPDKQREAAIERLASLAAEGAWDADSLGVLETAVAALPTVAPLRRAHAGALSSAGRGADAVAEYEEYLRLVPDDAGAMTALGELYLTAGRDDVAVDRLVRAVDAWVAAGDVDGAASAARRLIELEPQSLARAADLVTLLRERSPALLAEALEHLADVFRDRGKIGQEADACRDLLALAPERGDVRARLVAIDVRVVEVDPEDATAWTEIERLDPSLAQALRERGIAPDADAAAPATRTPLGDTRATVAQSPGRSASAVEAHALYVRRKGNELMEAGDLVGASLCLERAVRSAPDAAAHLDLAKCYDGIHRPDDALREALRSLAVAIHAENGPATDRAVGWLVERWPELEGPVGDAVILNDRPGSADIVYEGLLQIWDGVREGDGQAATAEPA